MADKVIFDGPNKLIIVEMGVTEIDVRTEMYHPWKIWAGSDDGSKFLQAFSVDGGRALNAAETQFAALYYYLMNGWRVFIGNGEVVNIALNLYSDPQTGAEKIFITTNNSSVQSSISDSVVITVSTGTQTPGDIEALDILRKIKFNEVDDVITTLDGEKVSTDDESRDKSKADISILL